jgi:hypothetical protein
MDRERKRARRKQAREAMMLGRISSQTLRSLEFLALARVPIRCHRYRRQSRELDLDFDGIPTEHKGKYSLVTNFGTTEHVANQLNAFKIIDELTALNGVMVHELPAQGWFNHGLDWQPLLQTCC